MTPPRHFKVFLSSPGDVAEERAIVRAVLDRLPREAPWKGKITIEVVSWDDPHSPTPLLASLTPQQAVDRGLPMPSWRSDVADFHVPYTDSLNNHAV